MAKMKDLQIQQEIHKLAVLQLRSQGYDAGRDWGVFIRCWNDDRSEAYFLRIEEPHAEFLANKYEA